MPATGGVISPTGSADLGIDRAHVPCDVAPGSCGATARAGTPRRFRGEPVVDHVVHLDAVARATASCSWVAVLDEDAGAGADHLRQGARGRRDDRHSARHRLGRREAGRIDTTGNSAARAPRSGTQRLIRREDRCVREGLDHRGGDDRGERRPIVRRRIEE